MIRTPLALGSVLLAACCLAIPTPLPAQPPATGKVTEKFSPYEMSEVSKFFDGPKGTQSDTVAAARVGSKSYAVFNIEFSSAKACAAFNSKNFYVFSRFAEFADVFLIGDRQAAARELVADDDVIWFENAGVAVVPPPPPVEPSEKTKDLPEAVVRDGVGKLKGEGVIIAVIDTGIDFRHPDFIRTNAEGKPTSRLLYYWDTLSAGPAAGEPGSKAPVSYPDDSSIGTIYTQKELTVELQSKKGPIPVPDPDGHGTACASVAAGSGMGAGKDKRKDYAGVAPGADLIAVRVGGVDGLPNTYLINAICDWIDKTATKLNKPVVISYSVGGQYGGHDGSRISERQLSKRFPASAKGRAICIAAGNEGRDALHADVEFTDKDKGELTWVSVNKKLITIYCNTRDSKDIVITGGGAKNIFYHPLAHAVLCEVAIEPSKVNKDTGKYEPDRLELTTRSGKRVQADAYLPGLGVKGYFTGDCAQYGKQIATPAAAKDVIAVGSYDWNDQFNYKGELRYLPVNVGKNGQKELKPFTKGKLSPYSNPGPSRDGKTIKPDVVAPGWQWSAAAPPNLKEIVYDTSGQYQLFDGTSAATPYTAGVVALMMQKKPTITFGEIKDGLHAGASKDYLERRDNGSPTKNPGWGYGKLDVKAVNKILDGIR